MPSAVIYSLSLLAISMIVVIIFIAILAVIVFPIGWLLSKFIRSFWGWGL